MIKVTADPKQKLLKLCFSEHVGPEEAASSLEKLRLALAKIQPGFRLLTDLSGLDSMDTACAPYIRKNMDLCNAAGVAEVIRVIPDPSKDIGLNILSMFHYRHGLRIVTCDSLSEALALVKAQPPS